MFYIKLIAKMLALETSSCTERRLEGKFTVKATAIILLLFAIFYAASPIDLIPEGFIMSWISCIDDVIVCAGAVCYFIADVTAALEGRKMGKMPSAEPPS